MKNFFLTLNILHIVNDGMKVSLVLLLPFIAKDLHFNLTQVGFLGSSINFMQVVFALPAAYLALKIGGLRTLLFAMCLYGVGFLLTSQANMLVFLAGAFIVAGMGFGLFHPIGFALVSKFTPEEKRGKALGDFTAFGDIGTIAISTVATFIVVRMGWHSTALMFSYLVLILFLALLFFSRKQHNELEAVKHTASSSIALRKNKKFLLVMMTSFLDALVSNPIFLFLPFLLLHKGVGSAFIGIGSGIFFAGSLFGKSYIGRMVDRFGNTKVFIAAELVMALLLVCIAFSPWIPLLFFFSFLLGAVTRGTSPATKTMIYEAIGDPLKAEKGFGISEVIICIATTIAPTLFGFLSDHNGVASAFAVFAFIAIAAVVPAIFFARFVKRDSEILQAEELLKTTF